MEITPVVAVVSSLASAYYTKKSSDMQKKVIKAERAANEKQYELDKKQAQLTLAEEQRKNRSLLAQQQSAYRAKLGASGMSSKSGTGQAVLQSLKKAHDSEDKYLINQSNISLEALLNGINSKNTQSLLSLSVLDNRNMANTMSSLNSFTARSGRTVIK